MKLSIITINYNNGIGLEQTIKSVINQTSKEFEYIIIDGNSTDDSYAIILKYKQHLKHWVSETDRGIYHAMNKGIMLAEGEYCQFLNSGDTLVDEDVVTKMLQQMPNSSIIIGNMLKKMFNGRIYVDKGLRNAKPTFLTFYRSTLNHSPAYIRRNLFEKYGYYDESLKIVSDWKWYLITVGLHNEKVVYRDIDVSLFDMTGISNSSAELLRKERRSVLEELIPSNILADYDKYGMYFRQIDRIIRYPFLNKCFWFLERVMRKMESLFKY